jgi:hypothetical protein
MVHAVKAASFPVEKHRLAAYYLANNRQYLPQGIGQIPVVNMNIRVAGGQYPGTQRYGPNLRPFHILGKAGFGLAALGGGQGGLQNALFRFYVLTPGIEGLQTTGPAVGNYRLSGSYSGDYRKSFLKHGQKIIPIFHSVSLNWAMDDSLFHIFHPASRKKTEKDKPP